MASFMEQAIAADKSNVDIMEMVIQQLQYEINAVNSSLFTAIHHPSYVTQSELRKQGHRLDGAVSLAVRMSGRLQINIPMEIRETAATVSKRAKEFKKA